MISTTGLVAYFPFTNESAADFSGSGHDITNLTNVAWGSDPTLGTMLSFPDRSVIRAAYTDPIDFSTKTSFSISWWCNKTASTGAGNHPKLLSFGLDGTDGVYIFCAALTDDMYLSFGRAGGKDGVVGGVNAFDATLRHYVLTFNLSTKAWILYRDGTAFPGGSGVLPNIPVMPNRKLVLGNYDTPTAANGLIGLLGMFSLYANRVLTPAEVADLAANPFQIGAAPALSNYAALGRGPQRGLMKMRATIERNVSVLAAKNTDTDAWGQKLEDWRELATVPCLAWAGPSGGKHTSAGETRTVTTDMPGMIVPKGTDITTTDRVRAIRNRAGAQLFGLMGIDAVLPRSTHTEVRLRMVS